MVTKNQSGAKSMGKNTTTKDIPYMIGFTENLYHLNEEPRYARRSSTMSISFNRAERYNKGAESNYQFRSAALDKKKDKRVQKLHRAFLDIVYEMAAEKKKWGSTHSLKELRLAAESRSSSRSSLASLKSSVKSLPCLEKTEHALLGVSSRSLPSVLRSKSEARGRISSLDNPEKNKTSPRPTPLPSVSKHPTKIFQNATVNPTESREGEVQSVSPAKSADRRLIQSNPLPRRRPFTTNKPTDRAKESRSVLTSTGYHKRPFTRQETSMDIIHNTLRSNKPEYKVSISRSPLSTLNSSSMRMEKERMNNIRRRYAAQIKSGPIDFPKLRRQILHVEAF